MLEQLAHWVKRRQLVAFFLLTYGISWGLLLSFGPMYQRGTILVVPLLVLALFGPALAGMIVSGLVHPRPRHAMPRKRLLAFSLTWLLAVPIFAFDPELSRQGIAPSVGLFAMAGVIALIPAFVVSSAFSRTPGIRSYLETLVKPRGRPIWYLVAVSIIPILLALSIGVTRLAGDDLPQPRLAGDGTWGHLAGLVILSALYRFFFANGCGEEPGWRGFALPRLQSLFSPLTANLILAFFWASWHLPLPQAQGLATNPIAFLEYYLGTLTHCIIIAWLFNKTEGSILIAGLVHVSSNISRTFLPEPTAFLFARPAFCLVLIVVYRMWERLPEDSAAVYRKQYSG